MRWGLAERMAVLARAATERLTRRPAVAQLRTVSGIGDILALTILVEMGEIGRYDRVGNCYTRRTLRTLDAL